MRLSVTRNKVELVEKRVLHQNEYGVASCQFEFTNVFNDLVKKAIFTNTTTGKSYEMPILNDACWIPAEALSEKGACTIGVYAFCTNPGGSELMLRYSPTPVIVAIESGSYKADVENPCDLTASQAEQYEATISQKVGEMSALMDSVNQRLSEGDLKGEKGDPGENGQDGTNGKSAYELAVAGGYTGTETEWLASLKGADGFLPEVNLEQINDTTAKLTVTKKDGSTKSVQFGGLWKESETEVY